MSEFLTGVSHTLIGIGLVKLVVSIILMLKSRKEVK